MATTNNWVLFYHEGTLTHYFWNGVHPIAVFPENGELWSVNSEGSYVPMEEKDRTLLNSLIDSKKRGFTIKDRGRFQIVSRGPFVKDDE